MVAVMGAHTSRRGAAATDATTEVAVVGAGMVGLSLACALGQAGIDTVVLDRAAPGTLTAPAHDGRVSALAAGTVRLLRALGVWPGIANHAEPILEIRVSDGDSPLHLHYDHRALGDEPLGVIVENRVLRLALGARLRALEAVTLRAPAKVAAVARDAYRARVELGDGSALRARLVVGADGVGSPVRTRAKIGVVRHAYGQTAIVCTVAHARPHLGIAQERFLASGPFAILPMTGNRSSLVWTERADLAPALLALDDDAFTGELAWRFTDYLGPVRPVGPRWSYPLAIQWARRTTAERLALAGDAAHAIHPIAGQGLNLGLRDVAALSEAVIDAARLGLDVGAAPVLEAYARARVFDVASMSLVTDGLNRLFSNDWTALRVARALGLAAVDRAPPLKRLFMRHAMGLIGASG
jgi:2-octaprenyl-6-methoxyphenol hydroxylase